MSRGGRLILVSLGLCLFSGVACLTAAVSPGRPIVTISANGCAEHPAAVPNAVTTAYDRKVIALGPVLYLTLAHPSAGVYQDLSKSGDNGVYLPRSKPPSPVRLPNGALASQFNGHGQYVQASSASPLSVTHTGCLTVEAWIRPAALQFPLEEGTGYANVLGKGEGDQQEYALRMYSERNLEVPVRPNRVSAYVFNRWGGWGSGAYFQDHVSIGDWMMVAFVVSDLPTSSWPRGYIEIYKNGQLRGRVSLAQYNVRPAATSSPFRIATQSLDSFFDGAIGDVAVYDYALPGSQIASTYDTMFTSSG
jgi:hypothetical protein